MPLIVVFQLITILVLHSKKMENKKRTAPSLSLPKPVLFRKAAGKAEKQEI
jgi:hypothetical protein